MQGIQYLVDDQGNKTSVVLSIEDWRNLSSSIGEVRVLEGIVQSVKEGLAEAKGMEGGTISQTQTTEDFLNEL